jgi:hypothetical protein
MTLFVSAPAELPRLMDLAARFERVCDAHEAWSSSVERRRVYEVAASVVVTLRNDVGHRWESLRTYVNLIDRRCQQCARCVYVNVACE